MFEKRIGNWVLKGYETEKVKTYYVYTLPFHELSHKFNNYFKAQEYFNEVTKDAIQIN